MPEIEDLEKKLADLKKQRDEKHPSSEIDRYLYLRARKEEMGTDLDEVERELSKLEDTEAIKNYEPMTHKEFIAAVKACTAKPKHEIKECIEEELKPACPECDIKKTEEETEEEPCPACEFAVGIGMYLNVYRDLDSEENCQELFEKVTNGEISPEEFFNIIKEKAKDKPKQLDTLSYIDELMEESSGESESQKEGV